MIKKVILVVVMLSVGYFFADMLDSAFGTWWDSKYDKPDYIKEAEIQEKLRQIENGE